MIDQIANIKTNQERIHSTSTKDIVPATIITFILWQAQRTWQMWRIWKTLKKIVAKFFNLKKVVVITQRSLHKDLLRISGSITEY